MERLFRVGLIYCKSICIPLVIIIIAGVSTYAQSSMTYLLDGDSGQPIEFATLQCATIEENPTITFVLSDEYGRVFYCDCVGKDSIKWKIYHLSYFPIDTVISCPQTLDTILMYAKNYDVDELIISAKDEGVRVIGDTIRFDLSVFRKPHQRDLKDLLKDLPGIQITEKGGVEYKGKPVGQIRLNGKSTAQSV